MLTRSDRPCGAFFRLLAILLLLAPLLATASSASAQATPAPTTSSGEDAEYHDPAGRFVLPVPLNWIVEQRDGYVLLRAPDGDLNVTALVVKSDDAGAGVIAGWLIVDPAFDPAAKAPDRVEVASAPGVDQTVVLTFDLGQSTGRVAQGLGQRVGNQVFVLIFRGDLQTAVRRQSQINVVVSGFRILSVAQLNLSGRAPLPLEGERLRTFEEFVNGTLAAFGVPGAAVAVVQGERVVYARGFGVTEKGGNQPVTPDTLMMVGSVTKSLTTMMMGTLVDDGLLAWNQPVVDILPSFKVADPAITPKVTVRNLVCACTGVPRHDQEIDFNGNDLTAENVIASLADFTFDTPIGEAFQYSNQMVAAGGYIAALAGGGHYGDLYAAFLKAMRQRVLDPIGMTRSTFDLNAAAADPDHSFPHGIRLEGDYQPMPLAIEAGQTPIAPAAALWSSANEMARYVITELNRGIAPGGNRVVSAKNLEATWQPQVPVSADTSYGLGWYVETWRGLRIVRHGGNTRGFTSDVAFLPDADLGVVVLTNAQRANIVASGIRQRLFELLYDQPSDVESQIALALDEAKQQRTQTESQFGDPIRPVLANSLTGDYRNPALGPVTITFSDGALVADAGEFRVALRPLRDSPSSGPAFVVADPPFAGFPVRFDTSGPTPLLIIGAPPGTVVGVDREYVFDFVAAATPEPSPAP